MYRWVRGLNLGMRILSFNIHTLRTFIINAITAGVATGLALNRRGNKDVERRKWPEGELAPFVQVIIPVRNEEGNIGPLLYSLVAQSYPVGRWGVTVVDDSSEDETFKIAEAVAASNEQVEVISAAALPGGWTGKNHALYTGYKAAPNQAEWLLFADADTRHHKDMLSSVVLRAVETDAALLSLVINVEMRSFWECVLVPQVGELYTLLVGTMDQVNRGGSVAAANGQFMLMKREIYEQIGELEEVKGDVAEDRAMAAAAKRLGYNVRLEYGRGLVSARVYSSLREMWAGYSKTLFWASGHDTGKALAVAAALLMYALLPPLAFLYAVLRKEYPQRKTALIHAPLQMIPMLALRAVVCRQMGILPLYALTYPLGVAVGSGMLLFSLYRVVSGKGVQWKGRTYR